MFPPSLGSWCEKQFLFSIYARKIMWTNSSHLTFNKKLNVLCGVTADGSRGIKWKWKDINARASATHGWRRLPLVTWLLCRACGWLGGPSGCAAPASELNDELCPGTPGTSAQLTRAHRRRKKTKLNKWKKWSALLKDALAVDDRETTFPLHTVCLPRELRQAVKQIL